MQVSIGEADLGTVIATDGILNGVQFETSPTEYNVPLTLVDGDRQLVHIDVSTSYVHPGTDLLLNGNLAFANLTVKSLPLGSTFIIDYEPAATEEPPPPAEPTE
jgi:hypothetical protein